MAEGVTPLTTPSPDRAQDGMADQNSTSPRHSTWQPIETAPKNCRVIVFIPDEIPSSWSWQIAQYDDDYTSDDPEPFWRVDSDNSGNVAYSRAHRPTYWAPFPDPPEQS